MLDLESLFKLNYPMCIMCAANGGKFAGCIVNTVFQIVTDHATSFIEAQVIQTVDSGTHMLFIAKDTADSGHVFQEKN